MSLINEPTDAILAARKRWKINRDILAGEHAVKAAGTAYLPRISNQKTTVEYDAYKQRTEFFPAAARTKDGLIGLVTRKAPTFECPKGMEDIFNTITKAGLTFEDLGEVILDETFQTAFPGMLADFPTPAPVAPGAVPTLGDLEAQNVRPFVAYYVAESILEVTTGVIANQQVQTRVRLLDDEETVRELLLIDGVYTIIMHRLINGEWVPDAPVTPLRAGQPINFIPFVLSTLKVRTFAPGKGPLDDLCDLNVHLYNAAAASGISRWFSSMPMVTLLGAEAEEMEFAPGNLLNFPFHSNEHPVVLGYLEFAGTGQKALDEHEARTLDKMAKLGSNILASERNAAEAAETHAIRRSSENSVLASVARSVSRAVQEVLDICAWWQTGQWGTVKYALNTDFVPQPMTPQERTALLAELTAGAISKDTYFDQLIAGEVLPDDFDKEAEEQRIAQDSANIDRPVTEEPSEPPVE